MAPTVDEGLDAYRPPEAQDDAPPEVVTGNWIYVSAQGLGRAVVVLFVIEALLAATMACTTGVLMTMLGRARAGDVSVVGSLRAVVAAYGLVVLLVLAVFIALMVLVCLYLPRSNRNARALGAEGMSFTPGWTAGWFFIPIVNLWRPYYAMKELWQATEPRLDVGWRTVDVPQSLPLWWWLSLIGLLGLRTPKDPDMAMNVAMVMSILSIISSSLAASFFSRLTARQEQRRQAVEAAGTAAPGTLGA